jgi:lysophospholipid acyltransferase (LPLAT)-like uncharacterized protein
MKLSHPAAIKSAALIGSMTVKAWFTSLSPRFSMDDPAVNPTHNSRPTLYLFWHEMMLVPAVYWAKTRIPVLVSQHRDGELIAQIVRMFGGQAVRGSTNRQGAAALRQMLRRAKNGHLAITPDGPRGPRRHAHIGPLFLASRAGMQIVPVGFAFSHCWRVKSWDRMALPKPFGIVQTVVGSAIDVPAGLTKDQLEPYREVVQASLDDVQDRSERMVERYLRRRAARAGRAFTPEAAQEHPGRPLQQILVH